MGKDNTTPHTPYIFADVLVSLFIFFDRAVSRLIIKAGRKLSADFFSISNSGIQNVKQKTIESILSPQSE